jgi:hypothetical protein
MTPYEYVKKCVNVKIAPSKVNGVGVFALRDIEIGEEVFTNWEGESGEYYLTENELSSLDIGVKSHLLDMFQAVNIDNKLSYIICLNKNCHWIFKTPLHWVNSCMWDEIPNFDKESMLVTKKILSGQELFTKYGKYNRFIKTNII